MTNRLRTQAFTLIELLIVVAIIAILAAIAVPNFLEAQTRSKVSRCKSDMRTLVTAWESYRVDYNRYPPDFDGGDIPSRVPPGNVGEWWTYVSVTTPVAYITSVPLDHFQKGRGAPPKVGFLYEYWGCTYNYTDIPEWNKTQTYWLFIGYGPNLRQDINGSMLADYVLYTYDPTNGTTSSGDICRTNVRMFPQ